MGRDAQVICSRAMEPSQRCAHRNAINALALLPPRRRRPQRLPPGFVYLRDVAPGIAQDMRYAGVDNFTGRPLPGYGAAECVLRRDVAEALKPRAGRPRARKPRAESLRLLSPDPRGRRLRALGASGDDDGATKRFYPALEKRSLFAHGYIAAHRAHSTGTAVDLTLVRLRRRRRRPPSTAARLRPLHRACARARARQSLDMGTGFDCFDDKSHTASAAISAEQTALARHARRGHARARLPQLFPRMVALQFRRAPGAGL